MSIPEVTPISAPEVSPESSETLATKEVVGEETKGEQNPELNPNESFSDWLKRQKASPAKDEPKKAKDTEKSDITPEETAPTELALKVGDKEFKVADIEQLQKAHTEAQDAVQTVHKQVNELVRILKTNPGQILDKIEVPREAIEQYYYEKYLQPEVFKSMPADQKVAHYEKQEAARKDAELKAKQDQELNDKKQSEETQKEHYRQEWNKKFQEAIEIGGLPKSDWVVARMAGYMKQALAKGLTHVTPQDTIPLIKEDLLNAQKASFASLTPEQLAATLGADLIAKLRTHESSKVQESKFKSDPIKRGKVERELKKPTKKYTNPMQLLDDLD